MLHVQGSQVDRVAGAETTGEGQEERKSEKYPGAQSKNYSKRLWFLLWVRREASREPLSREASWWDLVSGCHIVGGSKNAETQSELDYDKPGEKKGNVYLTWGGWKWSNPEYISKVESMC